MRVAVHIGGDCPVEIHEVPDPRPQAGEVVIEVGRCGICGSDIAMTSGSPFDYGHGRHLGHEYAGTVIELGEDVAGLAIGDRVAGLPQAGCGQCGSCRRGRPIFCAAVRPLFGGFGDYVALPASAAIRLPQSLSLADGALIEPIACGLRALRLGGMQASDRVLVLGAGSMAMAIVYWARRLGAGSITVASRSAHRREAALAMGADRFHSFEEDDPRALEKALAGGADVVAECIGKPGALDQALAHVRIGGTVVVMGMCMQPETLVPIRCTFREVRLVFPLAYSIEEFEATARAFDGDGVRPETIVSDVIALDRLPAVLEELRGGARMLKVQVDPRREVTHG